MTKVPNALAGRDNIEIEIFGLEGIPEKDRLEHERNKGELVCVGLCRQRV